jgi:hypothetical protein
MAAKHSSKGNSSPQRRQGRKERKQSFVYEICGWLLGSGLRVEAARTCRNL